MSGIQQLFASGGIFTRPSAGDITILQGYPVPIAGTTEDGSVGLTVNFPVPLTAGDKVIAFVSADGENFLVTDPVLVGGGAHPLSQTIGGAFPGDTAILSIYALTQPPAAGGETGVYIITNDAVRANLQVIVVSGLADEAAEDTASNFGNSNTMNPGEVTPISAVNLIVGMGAYARPTQDYASGPTAPFVRIGTGIGGDGVWQEAFFAIQALATNQEANMNVGLAHPLDWAGAAAAFGGE